LESTGRSCDSTQSNVLLYRGRSSLIVVVNSDHSEALYRTTPLGPCRQKQKPYHGSLSSSTRGNRREYAQALFQRLLLRSYVSKLLFYQLCDAIHASDNRTEDFCAFLFRGNNFRVRYSYIYYRLKRVEPFRKMFEINLNSTNDD
jgi:hypothetical protein